MYLDPDGALVWPRRGLVAAADLHLEKGSAAAARGYLLPPWDTDDTLKKLEGIVLRHSPDILLLLGDSFHDDGGPGRLSDASRLRLRSLMSACKTIWISGNHDPYCLPGGVPPVTEWSLDGITFRHEALPGADAEVCGHHHPKATVRTRAGTVTRACFVTASSRIMLPALGAFTGGLNVTDPAISGLFPCGCLVSLLGKEKVFSFNVEAVSKKRDRQVERRHSLPPGFDGA